MKQVFVFECNVSRRGPRLGQLRKGDAPLSRQTKSERKQRVWPQECHFAPRFRKPISKRVLNSPSININLLLLSSQ